MTDKKPTRKNIRMREYDYSRNGFYYITICTYNRKEIFGVIKNVESEKNVGAGLASARHIDMFKQGNIIVELTYWGNILNDSIKELQSRFNIQINNYIIMPNHIHMIIENSNENKESTYAIPEMICYLKSKIAMKYLKFNKLNNVYNEKLWQRNYYEHVIRTDKEYLEICKYMQENPLRYWLKKNNINQ